MPRDKFFDSNADFVSPQPQPPASQPSQPTYYQQPPHSYSSPSTYLQRQQSTEDRQYPASYSSPSAYLQNSRPAGYSSPSPYQQLPYSSPSLSYSSPSPSPYQQTERQLPAPPSASYSSTAPYLQHQQYDRQLPATPSYPPSASSPYLPPQSSGRQATTPYYTAPASPSPSQRPSLADRFTPVGSRPSLLSRAASVVSIKEKKKSSTCSYPCCGFRSGRTLCGCCMCFLFVIVAAVAAVFLLAKAPEIAFQSVEPPSNGLPSFAVDGPNFTMNFNLKIGIKNPNLIGVTLSKVAGEAKFPVSDSIIGKGNVTNLSVPKQSDQTLLFPFQIAYDPSIDPESKILLYVAKQCGRLGGTRGKLEINYTIKLSFGFLASLGIVPSFSNTASFDCPINGSQLPAGFGGSSPPTKRRRSLQSPIDIEISPSHWL